MPPPDPPALKADLHRRLRQAREVLVWKLEGLSDYDVRRPLTPTGTNLLGLVKHQAVGQASYFGHVFDRPFPGPLPWWEDGSEPNADMYAEADESRAWVIDFHRRAGDHADTTIEALALDATGEVPWWAPERRRVTLHQVLVHVITDDQRHLGHADILREQLDGASGLDPGWSNLPAGDAAWWAAYRDRLQGIADSFR